MAEENDLLRRYADSGDEEAFGKFVALRAGFVFAQALPRVGGDAHAARDASQLVFVAAARNARHLATHPQISGWLFTATRNACSTLVRAERRRKRREQQVGESIIGEPTDALADPPPDLEVLLDLLGERERAAVILRYFDNLSYAAVGKVLRISDEAARKCIERAVASLRRHLSRNGQSLSVMAVGTLLVERRVHALPAETAASLARGALVSSKVLSVPSATLLLHAMSQSKLIATALGIAGLAFVAAGYRNHARAEALNLETDSVQTRPHGRSNRSVDQAAATTVSKVKISKGTGSESSAEVMAAAEAGRALILERSRLARTDPECEVLMATMVTGALHEEYAHFYRQAGLSRDQETAIEKAVYDEEMQETDISLSAKAHGTATTDPVIQALVDQSKAALRTDLEAVLGDASYQAFVDYQASVAQRDFVETISGALWRARQPMSTDQFQQLLSAVESATTASGIAITDTNWTQLQAGAEKLLTPAQLPVWNAVVIEQKYSSAVIKQMNHP